MALNPCSLQARVQSYRPIHPGPIRTPPRPFLTLPVGEWHGICAETDTMNILWRLRVYPDRDPEFTWWWLPINVPAPETAVTIGESNVTVHPRPVDYATQHFVTPFRRRFLIRERSGTLQLLRQDPVR